MLEEYHSLKNLFESHNSPVAIKLFRAKSAPLILFFLSKYFKEKHVGFISNQELKNRLSDVLEQINHSDYLEEGDDTLQKVMENSERADFLIRKWSDKGYITFEPDEKGIYQHSLTSDTEKALGWLDSLRKQSFISTESKFIDIFYKLRQISDNSSDNWKDRVTALKEKKRVIESEIRKIEIDQKVDVTEDYYLQSRFNEVSQLSRSLMADFREVEENFNSIKTSIYEKQTNLEVSKGNILNYTLDALDEIRNTFQGKSFEAFYRHLLDDNSKDELTQLIEKVFKIMHERGIEVHDPFLHKLRFYLNNEGTRVRNSYHRLADKLNKVLSEKGILERKATIRLINEIKSLAIAAKDNPPKEEEFIEVDGLPVIELSMERPLTLEEPVNFLIASALKTADIGFTDMDIKNLVNQFSIDQVLLENNINELLKKQGHATLKEVIGCYPVTKGIAEILTYVNIATQSSKSFINRYKQDIIIIDDESKRAIRLPEIIYTK